MRVITLFTTLIALSTIAFAQDNKKSNIYDDLQWMKPLPNATVDEQITALIKRRMANLLYPVDMSSLAPPDKDQKFRDLIAVLQQQMGDPATGVLTAEEYSRLTEASRNIDGNLISVPLGKLVSVLDNGNAVAASGAGAWDENDNRGINFVRIFCFKARRLCEESTARLNLDARPFPSLDMDNNEYQITSWNSSRVTATIQDDPCSTALMTIDIKAQQVTKVIVPQTSSSSCPRFMREELLKGMHPMTWQLVDSFEVAKKISAEKMNKANAQATRAILLATATATTLNGLRSRSCVTHGYFSGWWRARFNTAWAPTTKMRLRYWSPRFEIGPSLCLPPVESSRGTIPIQAAKSRPDRKTFGSGTVAAMAVAPTMPIPGMLLSRLLASSERC
jgi:hypothetical protein